MLLCYQSSQHTDPSSRRFVQLAANDRLMYKFPQQICASITVSGSFLWPHWTITPPDVESASLLVYSCTTVQRLRDKLRAVWRGKIQFKKLSATQWLTKHQRTDPFDCDVNFWQGPRRAAPVGTPWALGSTGSKKSGRRIWRDLAAFTAGAHRPHKAVWFWSRELLAPPCGLCPRWSAGHALCDLCLAASQWVADNLAWLGPSRTAKVYKGHQILRNKSVC